MTFDCLGCRFLYMPKQGWKNTFGVCCRIGASGPKPNFNFAMPAATRPVDAAIRASRGIFG